MFAATNARIYFTLLHTYGHRKQVASCKNHGQIQGLDSSISLRDGSFPVGTGFTPGAKPGSGSTGRILPRADDLLQVIGYSNDIIWKKVETAFCKLSIIDGSFRR